MPAAQLSQPAFNEPCPGKAATGHSLVLASGILASRILGFLRDLLIAWTLGPSADAFLVAFRLPNFLRRVLAEGSLGMAQASAFAAEEHESPGTDSGLAGQVFSLTVTAALVLSGILFIAAPLVITALAPGLDVAARASLPELLRICLPYLPLCAASTTMGALLMARRRFLAPAWSPCLLNLGLILLPLFFSLGNGSSALIPAIFCLGLVLGGFWQSVSLYLALRRTRGRPLRHGRLLADFFINLAKGLGNPKAREALAATPIMLLGASAHHIHILAGTFLASFLLPGSISSLYFAERLFELPLGLAGAAVGMAALPQLAAAGKDAGRFQEALAASVRLSAFFSLPATAGLMALAPSLIRLLFGHSFDPAHQAATALALFAYALGLPAMCASRPLLHALAVLNERRAPLSALVAGLGGMLLCSALAMRLWQVAGIAFSLSLGSWIHFFCLAGALHRLDCRFLPFMRPVAAYFAGSLILAAGIALLPDLPQKTLPLALGMAGIVAGAVILWLLAFRLLKNPEALALTELFRNKKTARHMADGS